MGCASYWTWTDECRKASCNRCNTLVFETVPPADCSCDVQLAGFIFVAKRNESCPHHGQCRCGMGPTQCDGDREWNERKWLPQCPLIEHKPKAV